MKITDLLEEKSIKLNAVSNSKEQAINQLVNLISQTGNIRNKEQYKQIVLKREKQGTTGIGEGIAIPHGKSNVVKKASRILIVNVIMRIRRKLCQHSCRQVRKLEVSGGRSTWDKKRSLLMAFRNSEYSWGAHKSNRFNCSWS